jgi:uncharacterized protein YaiI (UPF0178 family)
VLTTASVCAPDHTAIDSIISANALPASLRRRQPYAASTATISVAAANTSVTGDVYDTDIVRSRPFVRKIKARRRRRGVPNQT